MKQNNDADFKIDKSFSLSGDTNQRNTQLKRDFSDHLPTFVAFKPTTGFQQIECTEKNSNSKRLF